MIAMESLEPIYSNDQNCKNCFDIINFNRCPFTEVGTDIIMRKRLILDCIIADKISPKYSDTSPYIKY
jgi:hypothetical protein